MNECVGGKISVCLLTFNHVEVIESTLQSILDQTISDYEVIVSDDCSTDGTWERILQLAAKDVRVRPIRTPHNMGMPGNANFAVGQTDRPYIALLHHDDIYRKDLLEKWAGILEQYPDVSFVFNRYQHGTLGYVWRPWFYAERFDGRWFLGKHLFAHWGCPVRGTAMIRKSIWDMVGGMREQFHLVADVDLWMRLSSVSAVGYVPEPLIQVRELRPEYYPTIYHSKGWSWKRLVYVFQIHASNRLSNLDPNSVSGKVRWLGFRLKLSCETAKWLTYGIIKRRYDIISTSKESVTDCDLWPLRAFRRMLQLIVRQVKN